MFSMMPYLLDNAKFLTAEMQNIFSEVVPEFMEPILRQGIADGSIKAYYELQQEMMVKNEAITAEEKCPVEDYVHFDLMTEASNY